MLYMVIDTINQSIKCSLPRHVSLTIVIVVLLGDFLSKVILLLSIKLNDIKLVRVKYMSHVMR